MAERTTIEWTDRTFNPWLGCQKVGPGCDHCYAEAIMAKRFGRVAWGPGEERVRTSPANWKLPLKWDREAALAGKPSRVFCASLADVFDNAVPTKWRDDLWNLIAATPHLDWLLLTKRPQNITKMLPPSWGNGWRNVWLGCTVVNQAEAERDIPHLLAVPAAVRFLSIEPLLGPVDLTRLDMLNVFRIIRAVDDQFYPHNVFDALRGHSDIHPIHGAEPNWGRIHLVIVGGESGPDARPMHPDWARSLRHQCLVARVPFFMKQMGGARKSAMPQIPEDLMIREFPNG